MMAEIRSEFRKLLTVRSTYVVTALAVALIIFIAFYLSGWQLDAESLKNPAALSGDVTSALGGVMVFGSIVAILLMSHEYRYNTIMYTLTSSNSRVKVLLAKFITVSAYAVFLTLLVGVLSPLMAYLGVHAHGNVLTPQVIDYGDLIWRGLFYGWGYSMAGLLLAVLLRNQIAAIVGLFLIPGLAENLIGFLLLKHNAVYLPFTALSQVINGNPKGLPTSNNLSDLQAAGIFTAYLVVGWVVAWILFVRRDAN